MLRTTGPCARAPQIPTDAVAGINTGSNPKAVPTWKIHTQNTDAGRASHAERRRNNLAPLAHQPADTLHTSFMSAGSGKLEEYTCRA